MNLFEEATRKVYRFPSVVGELTTEQLWHLPLLSDKKPCLNETAKTLAKTIRENEVESFVTSNTTASNNRKVLENKLDIVKYIIDVKQQENASLLEMAAKRDRRLALTKALNDKEEDAIKGMTREQILEELAKG